MEIEEQIKKLIAEALKALELPEVEVSLEHPQDEAHGEFSSNVAMKFKVKSEELKTTTQNLKLDNPRQIAEAIAEKLQKGQTLEGQTLVERVEVAGPGFINFYLSDEYYLSMLGEISNGRLLKRVERDGESKKRAIVEYSSPNIAKPFTIGHLRSTIIGDAIANVLEANGWEVLRDNHLGDWGTQFGKQICAIKMWGDASRDYTVKELVELYVRFHKEAEEQPELEDQAREWFKKLEDGEAQARELWQKCIEASWQEFSRIYQTLGVPTHGEFQNNGRGYGESFFEDKMGAVIGELTEKGLLKEGEEGAKLVFFPDDKYPPAMILKKDGSTLYHTRDLATDKFRKAMFYPDLIVNEVGAEQKLYFEQLFEMERVLGWYQAGQRVHVGHGMFRFARGKMSTRKGNVIWLQDVLEEAIKRAGVLAKDGSDQGVAEQVGIGALKWNDLKGDPKRDIVFDWDEILNMKGNSGPYVQYTYARTRSVLAKAEARGLGVGIKGQGYVPNMEEKAVLRQLARFGETISRAGEELAPHLVATYIYELAQRFNTFYNKHSILGGTEDEIRNSKSETRNNNQAPNSNEQNMSEEQETKNQELITEFRLALTGAVGQVLKSGLGLLGIAAPEKM